MDGLVDGIDYVEDGELRKSLQKKVQFMQNNKL